MKDSLPRMGHGCGLERSGTDGLRSRCQGTHAYRDIMACHVT